MNKFELIIEKNGFKVSRQEIKTLLNCANIITSIKPEGKLCILFGNDNSCKYSHFDWFDIVPTIYITLNDRYRYQEVLLHEYIHYLDFLKDGKWNVKKYFDGTVINYNEYYKCFYEYRAFVISRNILNLEIYPDLKVPYVYYKNRYKIE